jgi:hypothetical protein
MRRELAICSAGMAILIAGASHATSLHIWSYDPANAETRHVAGALTFEFDRRLVFTKVLRVLATEADVKAEVTPADEKALGHGGLAALIGPRAMERDLYQIQPLDEGPAMIAALCPNSRRAWLDFGRLRANHDLRIHVLGDDPDGKGVHLCKTLEFTFHGEWKLPSDATFDTRLIDRPQFPR